CVAMDTWQEGWTADSERSRLAVMLAQAEDLKRELRERARIVAERERELTEMRAELARRLDGGGKRGRRARVPDLAAKERELAAAIAAAEKREREAAAELALAQAERERLDERERQIHEVERELAQQRVAHEPELEPAATAAAPRLEDTVEITPPASRTRRR